MCTGTTSWSCIRHLSLQTQGPTQCKRRAVAASMCRCVCVRNGALRPCLWLLKGGLALSSYYSLKFWVGFCLLGRIMSNLKVLMCTLLTGFHVTISGISSEMSQLCCPILQRHVIIKKPVDLKSGIMRHRRVHALILNVCCWCHCFKSWTLLTQNSLGVYHMQRWGVKWYHSLLIPVHWHNWSIRRIHLIFLTVLRIVHLWAIHPSKNSSHSLWTPFLLGNFCSDYAHRES